MLALRIRMSRCRMSCCPRTCWCCHHAPRPFRRHSQPHSPTGHHRHRPPLGSLRHHRRFTPEWNPLTPHHDEGTVPTPQGTVPSSSPPTLLSIWSKSWDFIPELITKETLDRAVIDSLLTVSARRRTVNSGWLPYDQQSRYETEQISLLH